MAQPESDVLTLLARAVALRVSYWETLQQLETAMGGGAWSARAEDKIVDLVEEMALQGQPVDQQALAELQRRAALGAGIKTVPNPNLSAPTPFDDDLPD